MLESLLHSMQAPQVAMETCIRYSLRFFLQTISKLEVLLSQKLEFRKYPKPKWKCVAFCVSPGENALKALIMWVCLCEYAASTRFLKHFISSLSQQHEPSGNNSFASLRNHSCAMNPEGQEAQSCVQGKNKSIPGNSLFPNNVTCF